MRGPGVGAGLGQFAEAFENGDAVLSQAGSDRVAIRKMPAHRVEPDGAAGQKAAGGGGIGIIQHALEFLRRGAA